MPIIFDVDEGTFQPSRYQGATLKSFFTSELRTPKKEPWFNENLSKDLRTISTERLIDNLKKHFDVRIAWMNPLSWEVCIPFKDGSVYIGGSAFLRWAVISAYSALIDTNKIFISIPAYKTSFIKTS